MSNQVPDWQKVAVDLAWAITFNCRPPRHLALEQALEQYDKAMEAQKALDQGES